MREHDLIAVEDLSVRGLAQGTLAKATYEAGWGSFSRKSFPT